MIISIQTVQDKLGTTALHLYMLNPLAVIFQQFRHAMVTHATHSAGQALGSWTALLEPLAIVLVVFVVGFVVFDRSAPGSRRTCERDGADRHPPRPRAENERLRARVRELEDELVEVQARANAAVAHWQERAYWLDRWHLDLNALMRRRGASEFRALVRALRAVVVGAASAARRRLKGQ